MPSEWNDRRRLPCSSSPFPFPWLSNPPVLSSDEGTDDSMIAKYIQIAIGTLGRQLVRIKKGRALMASGLGVTAIPHEKLPASSS